ncbi:hypothetical protein CANINC_002774 [Pichia inconspicua]|uniref:Uncharacterized protein n=1 Tax=Pichia inconspicua TaxID=52247 RepID=A0A4T0X0B6_9ASCO|nr:hypothetical protein CANINC_002774 [[Candida] inconspicua]
MPETNKYITIAVYSSIYGKEDKTLLRQRQNKILFDSAGSTESLLGEQPLDSIQLMEQTCTIKLPEVEFLTYKKYGDDLEYEYEVQIIIDTHLINNIESTQLNSMKSDDLNLSQYQREHDEINELLQPYKRGITTEIVNSSDILTDLRTRTLLIPVKLTKNWTLIWIRFSKFIKLFEMIQIGTTLDESDRISYKSQQFLKWTIADLLSLDNPEDLIYNYSYVKMYGNEGIEDLNMIKVLQRIIKGYQDYGFNVNIENLPQINKEEIQGLWNKSRTRTLPFLELKDIQEINSLYLSKGARNNLPTPPPTRDVKKRSAELKLRSNFSTDGDGNLVKAYLPAKKVKPSVDASKAKRGRKPRDQILMKVTPNTNNFHITDYDKKIYVTLDNLSTIKETLDYDKKEMEDLVKLYTTIYDYVEAMLLDKWSKAREFSKNVPPNFEPPFLIYGPSQIEFEILKSDGIIATNSLKQKIKKYDVVLSTKTMRSLTSSRRWINQRFKFDPNLKEVYYTRDTNLIIPDYRDIPYIVLATHSYYGHMSADETFEVTHKNWYISRKMVQFIVSRCSKCQSNISLETSDSPSKLPTLHLKRSSPTPQQDIPVGTIASNETEKEVELTNE